VKLTQTNWGPFWIVLPDGPSRAIRFRKDYGEDVRGLFAEILRPGELVIDVGAHIGTYAVWFAKAGAQVICYEPNVQLLDILSRNAALYGFQSGVRGKAVADFNGELSYRDYGLGYAALNSRFDRAYDAPARSAPGFKAPDGSGRLVLVPCVTLDREFSNRSRVRLIKIDVEQGEDAVLRGAQNLLKNTDMVLIELSDGTWKTDIDLLERAGLTELYTIIDNRLERMSSLDERPEVDILAVRERRLARQWPENPHDHGDASSGYGLRRSCAIRSLCDCILPQK
jgi:FkbM family methyltransferase